MGGDSVFWNLILKRRKVKTLKDHSLKRSWFYCVCFGAVSIKSKQTQMKQGSSHLKSFTYQSSCQSYAQNKLIGFNFISNVFFSKSFDLCAHL